jgi:hypothetical protein
MFYLVKYRNHVYLYTLLSKPSIIKVIKSRMRWVGRVARMDEMRNVYKILAGKPEEQRPLGGPRRRWGTEYKNGSSGNRVGR